MKYIQEQRKRALWIIAVVMTSTVVASGWAFRGLLRQVSAVHTEQRQRVSVKDPRPVASAIMSLETRFGRIITYEDLPLVHPDDTLDVTESVRRDLHKYAPGKAPRVIVPRGGELNVEFDENDSVEVVLSQVLNESERVNAAATFRLEQANGVIHVIPHSIKGPTGDVVSVQSILDAPFQLSAQERTGMQMLEALRDFLSAYSKKHVIIGAAPFGALTSYKDDKGLSPQNARDGLTEILIRAGKGTKLSWQLFYDPGREIYAINIHTVR